MTPIYIIDIVLFRSRKKNIQKKDEIANWRQTKNKTLDQNHEPNVTL